ncbi:ABC transporter permease subunit [Sporosarcina obsidiansis]|uniref:ABC transporter permease subunit n=1 Tax=Sporosarcina obsidiansis TaxID=2660748 RepID=UPI00129AC16C|nr:ABC transporter permease subunit [Sporosarcina obsidiansis]
MSAFSVLTKKEFSQTVREFKIVWLPLVFILLGATQPIMMHYLPSILKSVGGMDGITIDPSVTQVSGAEVMASTIDAQFNQLGTIILVVSLMGVIQSEKANGMLSFILTRPVSTLSFVWSKVLSQFVFLAFCLSLGFLTSYGYATFLFSTVPWNEFLLSMLFYFVWLLFIVSFVVMVSTIFNSQGIIALIGIVFLFFCAVTAGLHPILALLSPAGMSLQAISLLATGTMNPQVGWSFFFTLLWIGITVGVTYFWIAKKKFQK